MRDLYIKNTLTRKKELFKPLNAPLVGMYVCGPTVYGDAHLGHARPGIVFDVMRRYLSYSGYKVRFVRNITDVGHLVGDGDQGEDKIQKKAKLEKLEPMEVVQHYTLRYHQNMDALNCLPPSIEPCASGHITEQIQMIEKILQAGYAYEVNGSVYFDVPKYNTHHHYGKLSGRKIEDLLEQTRSLEGGDEKRHPTDFALWKKAAKEHLMHWPSPWSEGFPGWHLECSVMSTKYLGEHFDIHGGGMDLLFPHHECEIAQSVGASGKEPVKYWVHNNMITINGQKMGKSLGNFITLDELFEGNHKLLEQAYSPMTIRFFILGAHYSSTLDFSNEALLAAQKGFERLVNGYSVLQNLKASENSSVEIKPILDKCFAALDDDFNTPICIAELFGLVKIIQNASRNNAQLSLADLKLLKHNFDVILFEILGLELPKDSKDKSASNQDDLMQLIIELRKNAKENKDYATSDLIRDKLSELSIQLKDSRDGTTWEKT